VRTETIILTYLSAGGALVVGAVLWSKYGRHGKALLQRIREKKQEEIVEYVEPFPQFANDPVFNVCLNWAEILHHDQMGEQVRISGTLHGESQVHYYLIGGLGSFRSFAIIHCSVGDAIKSPDDGNKALCNLKGSCHLIVRVDDHQGISLDLHPTQTFNEIAFKQDSNAFIALENHMSIAEGNSIKMHYKGSTPEVSFVKDGEPTASFGSFASFSDSASIVSSATEVVNVASLLQSNGKLDTRRVVPLSAGNFYLLGKFCADRLLFKCDHHIAIRFLTQQELGGEMISGEHDLDKVMSKIQDHPLVHLKIRLNEEGHPFVVYRHASETEETMVDLGVTNMVVSIPHESLGEVEIMRISEQNRGSTSSILEIRLNGLHEDDCPFVALWKY
jgi:hypothetical protein